MKNHAVRYGLYMGLAFVLFTFTVYFVYQDFLFNASVSWIPTVAISGIFMFLACKAERDSNNGSLNFGEAFKTGFIAYAIGGFISIMGMYVLFNFIDSSLIDIGIEKTLETQLAVAEKFGANEEAMAAMEEQMSEMGNPYTFGKIMLSYVFTLIFGAIIAAIVGAISKRNPRA